MNKADQAKAVVAEIRRDAVKMGHKIANGLRGEVVTRHASTEYKCVYNAGRVNWYIDGKRTSEAKALAAIEVSLTVEAEQVAQTVERAEQDQQAVELAAQLVDFCRSPRLSLGGLVERIKAAGYVTRETADAVIVYCEEHSLMLGGLVSTLASFSNEVADVAQVRAIAGKPL